MSAQFQVYSSSVSSDPLEAEAKKLAFLFARECGFRLLPWMERSFMKLLNKGFEYDLLLSIIAETARAPRPSWAYYNAIVTRCELNHAFDSIAFCNLPRKERDVVGGGFGISGDDLKRHQDIIDQAVEDFKFFE